MFKPNTFIDLGSNEQKINHQVKVRACKLIEDTTSPYYMRVNSINVNAEGLFPLAIKMFNGNKAEIVETRNKVEKAQRKLNALGYSYNIIVKGSITDMRDSFKYALASHWSGILEELKRGYAQENTEKYKLAIHACTSYDKVTALVIEYQKGLCDLLNAKVKKFEDAIPKKKKVIKKVAKKTTVNKIAPTK